MKKILIIAVGALLLVSAVEVWLTASHTGQKSAMDSLPTASGGAIGGDFTLTDQNGKAVKGSDFRGRLMLVFFGFTHCPDLCPISVATMSKAMELLGNDANQVAPIFITVDPKRDRPKVLKDFLANFDKHFVGLTGTDVQVKQVTDAYKVYFATRDIPWSQESPDKDHDADEHHHNDHDHDHHDYAVDHSGYIYLMGKDGKFLQVFPYNTDAQEIANAVRNILK